MKIINFFSSIMTHKKENQTHKYPKNANPFEIVSALTKFQNNKDRILKQLEQLGVNVEEYGKLALPELVSKTEALMRNTYSVKYLGLNKN